MILFYFGLLLLFIWWIANKALGDNFIHVLKYSTLLFIAIFIALDAFMFIETERFFKAKAIGGDLGITYSYFNNNTNSTVTTTMYGKQTDDSANIMAWHFSEFTVMGIFTYALPFLAIMIIGSFILQYLWIWYLTATDQMHKKPDKNSPL